MCDLARIAGLTVTLNVMIMAYDNLYSIQRNYSIKLIKLYNGVRKCAQMSKGDRF